MDPDVAPQLTDLADRLETLEIDATKLAFHIDLLHSDLEMFIEVLKTLAPQQPKESHPCQNTDTASIP